MKIVYELFHSDHKQLNNVTKWVTKVLKLLPVVEVSDSKVTMTSLMTLLALDSLPKRTHNSIEAKIITIAITMPCVI